MTTFNRIRRTLWPALDGIGTTLGRPMVWEKTPDEYVCSIWATEEDLHWALVMAGYTINPLAGLKYVVDDDGERVVERGSWAKRTPVSAKHQHHLYYFPADNVAQRLHLHQHKEISWLFDADRHQGGPQTPGDPDGVLTDALDDAGVGYDVLSNPTYG